MSGVVDICNTALGHLGDDASVTSIDPVDGSVQAAHCARFYPMARDALLEMHTWRFSTVRAVLALSAETPPTGWAFAYVLPSLAVRPIAVLAPGQLPDFIAWWLNDGTSVMQATANLTDILNSQDYIVEASPVDGTPILYTNVESASLVYSIGVTDPTKFSPLFVMALARLLASYLAGPIIKGVTGANVAAAHLKIFSEVDFPNATISDANARQSNAYMSATPAPIAARY